MEDLNAGKLKNITAYYNRKLRKVRYIWGEILVVDNARCDQVDSFRN